MLEAIGLFLALACLVVLMRDASAANKESEKLKTKITTLDAEIATQYRAHAELSERNETQRTQLEQALRALDDAYATLSLFDHMEEGYEGLDVPRDIENAKREHTMHSKVFDPEFTMARRKTKLEDAENAVLMLGRVIRERNAERTRCHSLAIQLKVQVEIRVTACLYVMRFGAEHITKDDRDPVNSALMTLRLNAGARLLMILDGYGDQFTADELNVLLETAHTESMEKLVHSQSNRLAETGWGKVLRNRYSCDDPKGDENVPLA